MSLKLPKNLDSGSYLQQIIKRNRDSHTGGVYAVCSAHPWVIDASIQQSIDDDSVLHVESTSSQVNQEGGYTGQTPQQFADFIHTNAQRSGISSDRVLLGGDHLGPYPWRREKSSIALEKACQLVHACILAGYRKIHLDASMACADDDHGLVDESTIAHRAAILAETAEKAFAGLAAGSAPLYVIGTEVPAPGGEVKPGEPPTVTTVDHVQHTLEVFQSEFAKRGLSGAWERVIGLVVQPGVEFGDDAVFDYDRTKVETLTEKLPDHPALVYEAHSTDYQSPHALEQMVKDHFAILKVGPWLTFAFREAIFGLTAIERELFDGSKSITLSQVRDALENEMFLHPNYWHSYYHGSESQQRLSRAYSYSDRCRYYWHKKGVQKEIGQLLNNLSDKKLLLTLMSQFFPLEYEAIRSGILQASAKEVILFHIQTVLRIYASACNVKGE